jgi:hypothetical protein
MPLVGQRSSTGAVTQGGRDRLMQYAWGVASAAISIAKSHLAPPTTAGTTVTRTTADLIRTDRTDGTW